MFLILLVYLKLICLSGFLESVCVRLQQLGYLGTHLGGQSNKAYSQLSSKGYMAWSYINVSSDSILSSMFFFLYVYFLIFNLDHVKIIIYGTLQLSNSSYSNPKGTFMAVVIKKYTGMCYYHQSYKPTALIPLRLFSSSSDRIMNCQIKAELNLSAKGHC